jgi:uncharacterized protein
MSGSKVAASCIAGIGLRQPHYRAVLETRPPLAFLEVHSENFFADGGAALGVLEKAGEHYCLSLHGVGLGLGSAVGIDAWHLERLARLAERLQPMFVSDHACFARAPLAPGGPAVHGNDLLPVAFTEASLALMVANVQQVQERLGRPLLVENLSAYVRWADDTLAEAEFFNALARRTGCGLLLDLNNLVVNALNAGVDPVAAACAHVDALDPQAVKEFHLAGYHDDGEMVIDAHGSRVHAPVWQVYRHAVRRLGVRPALIEWDTDVPELSVLLAEAALADAMAADTLDAAAVAPAVRHADADKAASGCGRPLHG